MQKKALIIMLAVASSAMGQSEPIVFQGSFLGMPIAQFRAANSESVCTDTTPKFYGSEDQGLDPIPGDVICIASGAPTNVAGKPVTLIQYHFFSGKLWQIHLSIEPQYFVDIMLVLVNRYRLDTLHLPGMVESNERFQNKHGATWDGARVSWSIGDTDQFISMREGPGNGPGEDGKSPLSMIVIQDTGPGSPKVVEKETNDF